MADPGLHSKFVESQQEDAFAFHRQEVRLNPQAESLRLDRARILNQLNMTTNHHRRRALRLALTAVESKMNGKDS